MGRNLPKEHFNKISPKPSGQMVITRGFLAAIGFERENDGERRYKPVYTEIWNRKDFDMPVAFHTEPPEKDKVLLHVSFWDDIEKTPISDFVNDLLDRQKASLQKDVNKFVDGDIWGDEDDD